MKNTGFLPRYINREERVLGSANSKIPFEILVPDGNWKPWQTPGERQSNSLFDSSNCTAYGTAKNIRTYLFRKFGIDFNPSERWIGIIAGTRPPGNDPHVVMEAIRHHGLIPESMLPFDETITTVEEYYSFKGANEEECRAEGMKWHEQYDFQHEWLFFPTADVNYKHKQLMENITRCPIGVSVDGWRERNGKYYKEVGARDNHWTMIESPEWVVFDSYQEFEKNLEQLYDFGFAKIFWIGERVKKKVTNVKKNFLSMILDFLKRYFKPAWE